MEDQNEPRSSQPVQTRPAGMKVESGDVWSKENNDTSCQLTLFQELIMETNAERKPGYSEIRI